MYFFDNLKKLLLCQIWVDCFGLQQLEMSIHCLKKKKAELCTFVVLKKKKN